MLNQETAPNPSGGASILFNDGALADMRSLVAAGLDPVVNEDTYLVMVRPEAWHTDTIDLERFAEHPRRKTGTFAANDIESFKFYVQAYAGAGSLIFADPDTCTLRAVIDHHHAEDGPPGWNQFAATFTPAWTTAALAWRRHDGRDMTQAEFATFLEQRVGEIAFPSGAELFELVLHFRRTLSADFDSRVDLSNGAIQLVYKEDVKDAVEVPTAFTIVLSPWRGASPIEATAYLRVSKPQNGKVTFSFQITEQWTEAIEALFNQMAHKVHEATAVPVVSGKWLP